MIPLSIIVQKDCFEASKKIEEVKHERYPMWRKSFQHFWMLLSPKQTLGVIGNDSPSDLIRTFVQPSVSLIEVGVVPKSGGFKGGIGWIKDNSKFNVTH